MNQLSGPKKSKHFIQSIQNGELEIAVRPSWEGKRINVKNTCSVFKHFKILLGPKS